MSYSSYQPEQPRNSGTLYPGWTSTVQYPPYAISMQRETSQGSSTTGASTQAAWSPDCEEGGYTLAPSPTTPTSGGTSPGYYSGDTQATATGDSEGDWSIYYNFIVPKDRRKESYWQLQDQYESSELMPKTRPVQRVKKSGREVYPCTHPGCTNTKPFKRTADLQRHYTQLHAPPNPFLKFHCDYPRCLRAKEPLGRKDHYRDHLRDYHGEDLVKRVKDSSSRGKGKRSSGGKSGGCEKDGGGIGPRVNVSERWWRCTKCLERKLVSEGWLCHGCKRECEEERVANRMRHLHHGNQLGNTGTNTNTGNLDDYSENEEEEDDNNDDGIIKTELRPPVISTSISRPRSQYHSTSSRSSIPQSSNICMYQCNNTWIYNSLSQIWEACPNCQGLIGSGGVGGMNSVDEADDVDIESGRGGGGSQVGNYRVSYTAMATTPLSVTSPTSTWSQSSLGTSYSNHHSNTNSNIATAASISTTPVSASTTTATTTAATPVEEYKTNCGNCSNYMVWDERADKWVYCPTCWRSSQDQNVAGGSGSGSGSRRSVRSEREREKEKEKKKGRRSSGWFG